MNRQQRLLVVLISAMVFGVLFNGVYKPQSKQLKRLKRELNVLEQRAKTYEAELPNLEENRKALDTLKTSVEALQQQLVNFEAQLPLENELSKLFGALVNPSLKHSMIFDSIKPLPAPKDGLYTPLDIELLAYTDYAQMMRYLHYIEEMPTYVAIKQLELNNSPGNFNHPLEAKIIFTTVLNSGGKPYPKNVTKARKKELMADEPIRSPFFSKHDPHFQDRGKNDLKLTGIISKGKDLAVIINDHVYRIGDSIDNVRVDRILDSKVILNNGVNEFSLEID